MRVLNPTGSFYLNLGDIYASSNTGLNDHRERKSLQNPERNPQLSMALAKCAIRAERLCTTNEDLRERASLQGRGLCECGEMEHVKVEIDG